MKFNEEKIIAKVEKDNKAIETYKIVCGGNRTYRLWIDNNPVDSIFNSEDEATNYAIHCAETNPFVLLGKAVVK